MASNSTTFTLRLTTDGVQEAQKQTKVIRDNLEAAAAAAARIGPAAQGATAAQGGSPGSRRLSTSQAAAPTGAGGAASQAASQGGSYETARAVIGRGAGARDFASESRGLSGLVQIYATLAANLYAASAAFNALSEAANIANLIKGLDQLSASSGQNLTKVANDLVKVTDGSISLQEAMKVVAKASSAGISTENISKLGNVAQKAAQALGIDAATAVDRLSRGITKLEPELLDELGLFTKIGPATEAYARKIGKSALSLTDFERRQAFANAVLAEGEEKFNSIATQANPFTKLTAQLKELTLSALTLVNKVAVPLVEFLNSNPTALIAALALIGKSLLGIAVPAVTSWKTNMLAASEASKEAAKQLVDARRKQRAWEDSLIGTQVAEKSGLATQKAKLALMELQNKALETGSKISAGTKRAVAGVDPEMKLDTEAQRQAAQKVIDDLQKRKEAAEKALTRIQPTSTAALAAKQQEIDLINRSTTALRERLTAEAEFNRVLNQPRPGWWTAAAADERAARAGLLDAQKKAIVGNALEQQSLYGTRAGFRALIEGLKNARAGLDTTGAAYTDGTRKLGALGAAAAFTGGSMQILGAGLSAVANAFNKVLIYVAIATAAFQALDAIFGKSKKQADEFKISTDGVNSSIKVANDALYEISNKKFLDPKSVQAVANAFNGLSDGLKKQIKSFTDLKNAQSGWDRWWDDRWDNIGRGSKSDLAKSVTNTILSALQLVEDGEKDKIQKQFEEALGFKFNGGKDLRAGIDKLVGENSEKLKELIPTFETIGRAAGNSAGNLTQVDAGLGEISKQITDINNSIKLTDIQGKLGTSLIGEAERMAKAFEQPKSSLIALQKIVGDFNLISLFPPEEAEKLARARSSIEELSKAYNKAESAKKAALAKVQESPEGSQARGAASAELDRATKELDKVKKTTEETTAKFKGIITSGIIEQAFKKVEASLKNALQEAAIISAKSYLSVLSSVGGKTAQAEGDIEVRQLESQRDLIKANYDHANEIIKLRLVSEQQVALDRMKLSQSAMENASLVAARENKAIEAAKAFISQTPGQQQNQFAQQVLGKPGAQVASVGNAAMGYAPDPQFQEKFNKYLAEQKMVAGATLQTALTIASRSESDYDAAYKSWLETSKAQKEFYVNGKLNLVAVGKAAKETGTFTSTIAKELFIQAKGLEGSLAKLDAQIKATKFETKAKVIRETAKDEAKKLGQEAEPLKVQESLIGIQQEALGFYNQELQIQKEIVQQSLLKNEQNQKLAILQGEIRIAENLAAQETANNNKKGLKDKKAADALASLQIDKTNILNKNTADLAALTQKSLRERLAGEQALAQYNREQDAKRFTNTQELQKAKLDIRDQELKYFQSIGLMTEKDAILEGAAIERARIALDIAKQRKDAVTAETDLKEKFAKPRAELEAIGTTLQTAAIPEEDRAPAIAANEAATAALNAREKEGLEILRDKAKTENLINESKLRGIGLLEQQAIRTAELKSLTETLGTIFGDLGTKLGGFATAISDSVERQKAFNDATVEQQKIIDNPKTSPEERASAEKKLGQLNEKYAKTQIDNNIKLLNSGKKVFSEKTAAYKALDAIEKVQHLRKIVENNKELFNTIKNAAKEFAIKMGWMTAETTAVATNTAAQTGIVAAGNAAQAASSIPAIFAKFSAMMGPWGWAAAAAVVAALGLSGKGGGAPPKGMDAKSRQETQGTGTRIDPVTGERIETGGGVLGDATAKSKSIANSLERIKETSVDGLSYSNKTVKLLESINKAVGGAAKTLYGVQGLRTGTAFGTKEGTTSSGISGLFGSKTTKEIIDSGVKFVGTFLDIATNKAGSLQQFETVSSTKKSSGFLGIGGSTKTSISESFKDFEPSVAKGISNIFRGATDLFIELGSKLGMTKDSVLAGLATIPVSMMASLKGLKGAELEEELGNVISAMMDTAAGTVFKSLSQYQKFGEGMAETVMRVLDNNEKVNLSFKSIGVAGIKVADTITETITKRVPGMLGWFGKTVTETITRPLTDAEKKLQSIEISEGLIDLAGGLEEFLNKQSFFVDNFLSESEKLAPIQEDLTTRLKDLGLSSIDTRDEFKTLVTTLGQDLSNPSSRELYNTLLDLAPAFAKVYKAADDAKEALSELDMAKKVQDQRIKMLELLGGEANLLEITNIKRKEELAELAKYPKEQADMLVANQKYIYALEDENALKAKLIKTRDEEKAALEKTVSAMKSAIDTLKNYRQTLLLGDKTLSTPREKYQQTQTEFDTLQAIITSSTSTTEEKAAAAGKLPAAADKLLDASKTMFASSDKYVEDFNKVLKALDISESILTGQQSDAEKQLDQLKTSTSFLDSISQSTKTTADLLKEYVVAQQVTAQARSGSATALTIGSATAITTAVTAAVVDTTAPTAPPPLAPTTTPVPVAVDNKAIIDLLADTVAQLEKLRTEQAQQTGSIIVTNAEAVDNSAQTIADAVDDSLNRYDWRQRQVVDLP